MSLISRRSIQTAVLVCLCGLLALSSGCGNKEKTAEGTKTPNAAKSSFPIKSGVWAELTLVGGGSYYGVIGDSDSDYVTLVGPYYPLANDAKRDKTKIRRVGSEFHGPESFIVVPRTSVASVQALKDPSIVLDAIKSSGDDLKRKSPSWATVANMDMGAVFLKDGRLLFGEVRLVDDEWIAVDNGYYLTRRKDADINEPVDSLDDMSLVEQASKELGRNGSLAVQVQQVLFVERLTDKSPVIEALAKVNP